MTDTSKHIFVARHGQVDGQYQLTAEGILAMQNLGFQIRRIMGAEESYIVSSGLDRAKESALELRTVLRAKEIQYVDWLLYDADEYLKNLDRIVEERPEKAIIAVGHEDFVCGYPKHYQRKHSLALHDFEIKRGRCVHIHGRYVFLLP